MSIGLAALNNGTINIEILKKKSLGVYLQGNICIQDAPSKQQRTCDTIYLQYLHWCHSLHSPSAPSACASCLLSDTPHTWPSASILGGKSGAHCLTIRVISKWLVIDMWKTLPCQLAACKNWWCFITKSNAQIDTFIPSLPHMRCVVCNISAPPDASFPPVLGAGPDLVSCESDVAMSRLEEFSTGPPWH